MTARAATVPTLDYSSKRWRKVRAWCVANLPPVCFCGELIDLTLPATHRLSVTVDHIVPVALGGDPYDKRNLRLATRACNAARRHHGDTAVRLQHEDEPLVLPTAGAAPWH